MTSNWIKYKIMTYNCYLAKKTKQELYKLLLYKLDRNIITLNELDIIRTLVDDEEVQEILDHGYIKSVDRIEDKKT